MNKKKGYESPYSRYYRSKHFVSLVLSVILDVLEKLGTTRSLSIAIAIRNGQDPANLLDCDPLQYFDAHTYQLDCQAIALVKKTCVLNLGIDPILVELVTLDKWETIEQDLIEVNREIRSRKNFALNSNLETAKKILSGLLPPLSSIEARDSFIPKGATAHLKGLNVNIANKLEVLDITSSAFRHFKHFYGVSTFSRGVKTLMTSLGSTFEVVDKDIYKKRTIAKEPMGNMILQLDAARVLRRALGRIDINLATQQVFHGFLVRNFYEEYATVDLSDASDRISVELVRALLPDDWYRYLNEIRTKHTFLPCGKRVTLEKFSPQGNGFTFELETLIFYSLCRSIVPEKELVSVYGDDMIVPCHYAERVHSLLESCGLVVNRKKSYHFGPFRESCGVDTFNGVDVRPVYLKEYSRGLFGYYELFNQIIEIERRTNIDLARAVRRLLREIRPEHQVFGLDYFNDQVLRINDNVTMPNSFSKNGIKYHLTLQRKNISCPQRIYNAEGKLVKNRTGHQYLSVPDEWLCEYKQLSYALSGYPSTGMFQRNCHYFEKFQKSPLS